MSQHFLCEIGCEEIPTSAMQSLQKALADGVEKALAKNRLEYKSLQSFAAPRRLAVLVSGLASKQADQNIERQGPALSAAYGQDGLPTIACLGFMRSCEVSLDDLKVKETAKGSWVCCQIKKAGAASKEILPQMMQQVITQLPIKKPMRWGIKNLSFIRPVHWIVMMLDKQTLNAELFSLPATNKSRGHRVLHPKPVAIASAADYAKTLQTAAVIPCFATRRQTIEQQLQALSNKNMQVIIDPDLLDEVTTLVEWPQALVGDFNEQYLKLPKEVLTTVMKSHQKCFAIADNNSAQLQAKFCTIANITSDNPSLIIHGNQRVMHARLADAQFFYDHDRKRSLEDRLPDLAKVNFHKKLGSLADKVVRIEKIADYLAAETNTPKTPLLRAAKLCKCDLLTDMVGEFPELQGTIGSYYASADNETSAASTAIGEHYLPRNAQDILPDSDAGACLAIADRIDTLVGMVGIGQAPTGEKDPFALRRQALAIIRIHQHKKFALDLPALIAHAAKLYNSELSNQHLQLELMSLIYERLRHYYQEKGIANSIFNAVVEKNPNDLADFEKRIAAMQNFMQLPEAKALSAACKRVKNILKKSASNSAQPVIDEKLFSEKAETSLYQAITKLNKKQTNNPEQQLLALAALKKPIDAFFDQVMVNCEQVDVRSNRLSLLQLLYQHLTQVADINLIHDH